ncbi:MAG: M4 family metallopeptidase, partial [Actinomycetota bacterium]|nr:M4 family metallopeptidase [Actinomycetota bacterium]
MRRTLLTTVLAAATAVSGAVVAVAPATAAQPPEQPPQAQTTQATAVAVADAHVEANGAQYFVGANDEVVRTGITTGGNGVNYVSYDRTHRGLPVVGGDFVVVTNASGAVVNTSVAQDRVLNVTSKATVSAQQAKTTSRTQLTQVTGADAPRLVVLAWGTPSLAWETVVRGTGDHGPSILHVFVDAATGQVVASYDEVRSGTGKGAYYGDVSIDTSGSGSSYSMTDTTRPGIKCGPQSGSAYTGTDNAWGNGNATDLETACVDALYGVQKQSNMMSEWYGRNGIDGRGNGFPLRVGLAQANAFWNGSYTNYGYSNNRTQQAVAIDIVAHENGHAIFSNTPGGAGSGNENGGINEGTGDIFGALVEAYVNSPMDPPDYLVGEEISLVGSGEIRNMYDPSQEGDPNCFSSAIPNTEVHSAAGPLNHWFYLLAEGNNPGGGKPSSPICSGGPSSVTGVGIREAGKVFYNALLAKTSSWKYVNVRTASLSAAKNLYQDCTVFNSVKAAWNAVSVPAQSGEATCTAENNDFSLSSSPASGTVSQGSSVNTTISTTTTSGTAQNVTLSASGLPSGATASFSPTSVTSGNASTLTISAGASTPTGTYNVTVTGTGGVTRTTTYSLTVQTGGGGGTCEGTNGDDVAIGDNQTVESTITISGCSTAPSSTSTVPVKVVHTYQGDLVVNLVAPDGTAYPLQNRTGGSADNIDKTFTVDLSSETANGAWKLRVQDVANGDIGRIDTWSLNLGGGGTPADDFSLGLSPASGSVARGSSVNTTVNTATTSGSAQNVALSASGLPAGATASFSPSSVTSGS